MLTAGRQSPEELEGIPLSMEGETGGTASYHQALFTPYGKGKHGPLLDPDLLGGDILQDETQLSIAIGQIFY
jgi:hypothetical protein